MLKEHSHGSSEIDKNFIVTIISYTVKNLFLELFSESITFDSPISLMEQKNISLYDISGSMSFGGELKGFIILSFKEDDAAKFASKLSGEKYDEVCFEVMDIISEFTNIILGNSGSEFNFKMTYTLPIVYKAKEFGIFSPKDSLTYLINFKTKDFLFKLVICFKSELNIEMDS